MLVVRSTLSAFPQAVCQLFQPSKQRFYNSTFRGLAILDGVIRESQINGESCNMCYFSESLKLFPVQDRSKGRKRVSHSYHNQNNSLITTLFRQNSLYRIVHRLLMSGRCCQQSNNASVRWSHRLWTQRPCTERRKVSQSYCCQTQLHRKQF